VRPGELRGAEWSEFDLDAAEWRIPARRMKMREPHTVPLSQQAVAQLKKLHALTGEGKYLFPNYRRPQAFMNATTLNRALEYMGYKNRFSAHGFRGTASTILNEMGFRPDVIERQLAHKERNAVRAAYNHATYLPERRQMMQAWADFIDSLESGRKVIPGRFNKAV
jgi:integrase